MPGPYLDHVKPHFGKASQQDYHILEIFKTASKLSNGKGHGGSFMGPCPSPIWALLKL